MKESRFKGALCNLGKEIQTLKGNIYNLKIV